MTKIVDVQVYVSNLPHQMENIIGVFTQKAPNGPFGVFSRVKTPIKLLVRCDEKTLTYVSNLSHQISNFIGVLLKKRPRIRH